jgi:hypothetical protein
VKFINSPVDGEEINLRLRSCSVPFSDNNNYEANKKNVRVNSTIFITESFQCLGIFCVALGCYKYRKMRSVCKTQYF